MVKIEAIGGHCPVEGEGTMDGIPFYFRARGNRWEMAVGELPIQICCGYSDGWVKYEKWCDEPFEAGWMDFDDARELIY